MHLYGLEDKAVDFSYQTSSVELKLKMMIMIMTITAGISAGSNTEEKPDNNYSYRDRREKKVKTSDRSSLPFIYGKGKNNVYCYKNNTSYYIH